MSAGERKLAGSPLALWTYYKRRRGEEEVLDKRNDRGLERDLIKIGEYYQQGTNETAPEEAFQEVLGKAAERLGLSKGMTFKEWEDLCNGRLHGEQLVHKSPYRYDTDVKRLTELADQISKSSGISRNAALAIARNDSAVVIKVLSPKPRARFEVDKVRHKALKKQLIKEKGLTAKEADALAAEDPRTHMPIVVDKSMKPTYALDDKRVDILTQHFIDTRNVDATTARQQALNDPRALVKTIPEPRVEPDPKKLARAVKKLVIKGMSEEDATAQASQDRSILVKYVSPPTEGPYYEVDDRWVKAKTTELLETDEWKERIRKTAEDLTLDEKLSPPDAIAKATKEVRREASREASKMAESDPRSLIRVTEDPAIRAPIFDVFISPDKSVDVLLIWLVKNGHLDMAEKVVEAWERSVLVGARSLEENARVCRVTPSGGGKGKGKRGEATKMQGGATERVTAELVMVKVTQHAARPTDASLERGYITDLHLHTHFAIPRVGWVKDDEAPGGYKTYTLDEYGLKANMGQLDNVVMAHMSRELEELNIPLDWYTTRNGLTRSRVRGINQDACRYLSTNSERQQEIREQWEAEHHEVPKDWQVRDKMRETRHEKMELAKELDDNLSLDHYARALEDANIDLGSFVFAERGLRHTLKMREQHLELILESELGLCKDTPTVSKYEIRDHVMRCSAALRSQSLTYEEANSFIERYMEKLVEVQDELGRPAFTCKGHIQREQAIEDFFTRRMSRHDYTTPDTAAIAKRINNPGKGKPKLDIEQQGGLYEFASGDGVVVQHGEAGTGKTKMGADGVEVMKTIGPDGRPCVDRVIVLAVAAKTAIDTGQKLKADHAYSIEGFIDALKHGLKPLTDRDLVIIDEAAMVDTSRMYHLTRAMGDARLRLFGDPSQLTQIGAGGWYSRQIRRMEASEDNAVVEFHNVYRQREVDESGVEQDWETAHTVNAYKDVRRGKAEKALRALESRGRVHIAMDHEESVKALLDDYKGFRDEGKGVNDVRIILDTSNADVDELNRLIQLDRADRGELSGRGIRVRATDVQRREWTLFKGDEVMFLEPTETPFGRINNGTTGTITSLDHETNTAQVYIPSVKATVPVALRGTAGSQPLGLAYAQHAFKIQGGEIPIALIAPGSLKNTSLNAGYSVLTRAVQQARIYLNLVSHRDKDNPDPIAALGAAWQRTTQHRSILDTLDATNAPVYREMHPNAEVPLDLADRTSIIARRRAEWKTALTDAKVNDSLVTAILASPAYNNFDRLFRRAAKSFEMPIAKLVVEVIKERSIPATDRSGAPTDPTPLLISRLTKRVNAAKTVGDEDTLVTPTPAPSTVAHDRTRPTHQPRMGHQSSMTTAQQAALSKALLSRGASREFVDKLLNDPTLPRLQRTLEQLSQVGANPIAAVLQVSRRTFPPDTRNPAALINTRLRPILQRAQTAHGKATPTPTTAAPASRSRAEDRFADIPLPDAPPDSYDDIPPPPDDYDAPTPDDFEPSADDYATVDDYASADQAASLNRGLSSPAN